MIGTAAIIPFLLMIAVPNSIPQTPLLAWAYELDSFKSDWDFPIVTGWAVSVLAAFSMAFKVLTIFMLTLFSLKRNYSLSAQFLTGYLHQPFGWFRQSHIADISKTVRSGRQLQRISIARVSHHNPTVLIFDEKRAALDSLTERVVISAMANLSSQKVLVIVTHKLSTVRDCIYLLKCGLIVDSRGYDDLLAGNSTFRAMVGGS